MCEKLYTRGDLYVVSDLNEVGLGSKITAVDAAMFPYTASCSS